VNEITILCFGLEKGRKAYDNRPKEEGTIVDSTDFSQFKEGGGGEGEGRKPYYNPAFSLNEGRFHQKEFFKPFLREWEGGKGGGEADSA